MLMCIQNVVRFCQFVLKILSGNQIFTESRKDEMTEGQGESSIAPLFQSGAIINISRVHQILFAFVYFYVCPRPLTRQSILSESVVFTFIKQTKVAFCVDEVGARHEKTLH